MTTTASVRRPLGSISNNTTSNIYSAAGSKQGQGKGQGNIISASGTSKHVNVKGKHPYSTYAHNKHDHKYDQYHDKSCNNNDDQEIIEIQEVRKSRERDEVTGLPKYSTLHRYFRGKMLGKGGFAKVYLASSAESHKDYAVKIVPKANLVKSRARAKLQAEIRIHRSLKHQNICDFKHFFEDGVNCYIMLELCHNQSMNELLKRRKRLTEPEVLYFMRQIVQGTKYMHSINVIHRDLKLGNLFLDGNMCVKIGDLGLAAKLAHVNERRKTICGTPNYIAPEIINGKNKEIGHTYHVDLWSTGVIMFALLCGKPPFESKDVKSTYKRILDIDYSYPKQLRISPKSKDVIDGLLQKTPEERLSLDSMLIHPALDNQQTFIPQQLSSDYLHNSPEWEVENMVETKYEKPSATLPSFSSKREKIESSVSNARPVLSSYSVSMQQSAQSVSSKTEPNHQQPSVPKNLIVNDLSNVVRKPQRPSASKAFEIYGDGARDNVCRENLATEQREDTCDTRRYSYSTEKRDSGRSSSYSRQSSSRLLRSSSGDVCELAARTSVMTLDEKRDDTATFETLKYLSKTRSSSTGDNLNTPPNTSLTASNLKQRKSFSSTLVGDNNHTNPDDIYSKSKVIPPPLATSTMKYESKRTQKSATQASMKDVDIEVLEFMHKRLVRAEKIQAGENIRIMSPQPKANDGGANKWVSRYVDYTSKYGLGFLLNDGSTGVCFNDSTKAVLSPVSDAFNYIERRKSKQVDVSPEKYKLSDYPECLEKKVLLLKHFRSYLMDQDKRASKTPTNNVNENENIHLLHGMECSEINSDEHENEDIIYVKKWVRTRHAILFRLSDRTVQVVFFDHTELVLSAGARLITYVDKCGDRTTFSLNTVAAEANAEISKRLRYAKDIMHQLITGQSHEVTC